ncbi:MAG: hypothetical protein Q7T59_03355, partial [Candidatus Woesebacteria bacterium]|nr:hypothetical protein [Candidatus Woesebacteria bacterium]
MRIAIEWQLLAGRLRSPKAASEHPSWQNLSLADRQLSGNRYGRFGHQAAPQVPTVITPECVDSDDPPTIEGSESPADVLRHGLLVVIPTRAVAPRHGLRIAGDGAVD